MGVARAQTAFVEEQVKQEVQAAVEATLAVRHSPTPPRPPRLQLALPRRENRRQRLSRLLRAQNAVYAHQSVPQWTSDIIEGSMKKLTGLQKPFKYIGAPAPRPQPPLPPRIGTTFALPDSGGSAEAPVLSAVSCIIMQKNGAGLHTASSCFWDNQTDGSCAPPSASLSPLALASGGWLSCSAGVVFAFEGRCVRAIPGRWF